MKRRKKKRNLKFRSRNKRYEIIMKLYHFTSYESFKKIYNSDIFKVSKFENANDNKEKTKKEFDNDSTENYSYISFCIGEQLTVIMNAMMWYHYGNKYKGVLIEIDKEEFEKKYDNEIVAKGKVEYIDGITKIDSLPIIDYMLAKRTCWVKEREYRYLFKNTTIELANIKNCISKVYILDSGMDIPKDIPKDILNFDRFDGRINRDPRRLIIKNKKFTIPLR